MTAFLARGTPPTVTPTSLDVERARRGDPASQRRLYEIHAPSVFGFCLAFCRGDHAAADDLCQETFLSAFASLDRLADPGAFAGWVRVIARRQCLRWLERKKRDGVVSHELPDTPTELPPPDVGALAAAVLLDCRDEKLRTTAALFYGDPPLSTAQIAESLGLTVTAVTTRLSRFRAWARVEAFRRLAEEVP